MILEFDPFDDTSNTIWTYNNFNQTPSFLYTFIRSRIIPKLGIIHSAERKKISI